MFVFGAGVGLGISQLPNVIMSAVGDKESSEAGGLQGTFQYLGASLGTALIGAALLSGLSTGLRENIDSNPALELAGTGGDRRQDGRGCAGRVGRAAPRRARGEPAERGEAGRGR